MDLNLNDLKHIGIIMDGNRRWALSKNLSALDGHNEGLKRAKEIVKYLSSLNLKYLSLYVFSTENWKRAEEEVKNLMFLLVKYLKKEFSFYKENKVKILVSGEIDSLSNSVKSVIREAIDFTKDFKGLTVNLAINYGGRAEILRALKKAFNSSIENINEESFEAFLDNPSLPNLDLVIRTGGDFRVSNFFIWQIAYSELIFNDKFWPNYFIDDLKNDIAQFFNRKRRFGR